MGNVAETWMDEEVKKNAIDEVSITTLDHVSTAKNISSFSFFIKNKIFAKLFDKKAIRKYFYRFKGLPNEVAKNY